MRFFIPAYFIVIFLSLSCSSTTEKKQIEDYILLALERNVAAQKIQIIKLREDNNLRDVFIALSDPLLTLSNSRHLVDQLHESKRQIYLNQTAGTLADIYKESLRIEPLTLSDRIVKQEILLTYFDYEINNALSPLTYREQVLPLLENQWDSDLLQFYSEYRVIDLLSTIISDENNMNEFLLINQYLLSRIEQLKKKYSLVYCEQAVRSRIALKLYKEYDHEFYEEYINFHLNNINDSPSVRFNGNFYTSFIRANLSFEKGETGTANEIIAEVNLDSLGITQKSNLYLSSGYFLRNSNPTKAYSFFKKSFELYKDTFSFAHATTPLLYMMDSSPNVKVYNEHKNTIDRFIARGYQSSIINYRKLLFTIDSKYEENSDHRKIELLLEQRRLAKELWGTEPNFHIQDLYALNAAQILENAKKILDTGLRLNPLTLPTLIHETKSIELKRKRVFQNKLALSKAKFDDLTEQILITNEFLDTSYDGHQIYIEIWNKYKNKIADKVEDQSNNSETNIQITTLPKNIAVVEYLKFADHYWSYIYDDSEIKIFKYPAPILDSLLEVFQYQIQSKGKIDKVLNELRKVLTMDSNLTSKTTLIFPDGELYNLPFDLIFRDRLVKYHYDLTEFMTNKKDELRDPDVILFSYSDSTTLNSRTKLDFPELPYGWREVNAIEKIVNVDKVFAGSNFQKSTLINNTAQIWHISSHASMNKNNRLDNFLLCRTAERGTEKVYNFEIENLTDVPKVAILSACETGNGLHRNGAGSYSLSRSFIYAGTDAVIKTLWSVNDRATSEFMVNLYKHWLSGNSLENALYKAKEDFKAHKQYSHPFYWAAFMLEGNGEIKINFN